MLGYYVNDLVQQLNTRGPDDGWQVHSPRSRDLFPYLLKMVTHLHI
jgi:hypothetical protein